MGFENGFFDKNDPGGNEAWLFLHNLSEGISWPFCAALRSRAKNEKRNFCAIEQEFLKLGTPPSTNMEKELFFLKGALDRLEKEWISTVHYVGRSFWSVLAIKGAQEIRTPQKRDVTSLCHPTRLGTSIDFQNPDWRRETLDLFEKMNCPARFIFWTADDIADSESLEPLLRTISPRPSVFRITDMKHDLSSKTRSPQENYEEIMNLIFQ